MSNKCASIVIYVMFTIYIYMYMCEFHCVCTNIEEYPRTCNYMPHPATIRARRGNQQEKNLK